MEEKKAEQMQPQEKKVASIGNQYTKEQVKQFNQAQKRVVFRRRRLAVIFAVAAVFFVLTGLNLFRSYRHINDLRLEKQVAETEQSSLRQQVAGLEYDVKLLGNDEYLQKLARQKYFYTKDGELVYSMPQVNPNAQLEANQKETQASESNSSAEK